AQSSHQLCQSVTIGRNGSDRRPLAVRQERLPVEALAAEVQSDVQHCRGLPSSRRGRAEFLSAGGPPSSDSVAPISTDMDAPCVLPRERASHPSDERYPAKPS